MTFINTSYQLHSTPPAWRVRRRDKGFILRNPALIAATLSETAFAAQSYRPARLFINNVLTPFMSAEISAPRKTLGKSLQIQLARADLQQLPIDAVFKFQIVKMVGGVEVPVTILDGAKLLGKNYSVSFERDSLSFTTSSDLSDKLSPCPLNNLIVFDGNRQQISTDEIENRYTNTEEIISTSSLDVRPLTLAKLLDIAFVEGCGFSSVVTNIPNWEIARCDFSTAQTYESAIAPFIGIWEPEFSETGGVLQILTSFADLPEGFIVTTLPNARMSGFSQSSGSQTAIVDGYDLQYMAKPGSSFADRDLPDRVETAGEVFDSNYTVTTIETTIREWFEGTRVVDSKIVKEVRTTVSNESVFPSNVETEEYTFDRLGRSLGYTKTVEARIPDVSADGAPSTMTTREETQKIDYAVNPFAPRTTYQRRIVTVINALLAVDDENKALDKNGEESAFKQNYEKVFEAGNLKKEMSKEFAPVETITETFEPLRNGQIKVRHVVFDNIREKQKSSFTDVRTGDLSVANYLRPVSYTIFKEGVTQATRTGKPIVPFNVGELPFFFAEGLTKRKLELDQTSGQIEVPGFDESIERGVLFALPNRDGSTLGNFLTTGCRIPITQNSIKTIIDAIKI